MRTILINTLVKCAGTFLVILVIMAGLQFMVRLQPGDTINLIAAQHIGSGEMCEDLRVSGYAPSYFSSAPASTSSQQTMQGTIGLSTGGSKDITNFRDNIYHNYLPLPTSISYEGLFYDYYFDTGISALCNDLFCPSYSYAVTRDPVSHQTDYYLSVGLNSGLREGHFQRKKLNLVIVVDISGSMSSEFDRYYYDGYGTRIDTYAGEGIQRQTKIESAKQAVIAILDQLRPDDRVAIVVFSNDASIVMPMSQVTLVSIHHFKARILDLNAGGTTNLSSGLDMATTQFCNLREVNNYEYENRIVVLTDAQPNTGAISVSRLSSILRRNADGRIYTTFIGIGVDFNTELIELITKTRGANYYSVHSPREFSERVEQEFDYMVTPLVFDVELSFESNGWRIQQVFGSPEANAATGHLMRINTLFPSKREEGQTRGGLVLLKLERTSFVLESDVINLRVTYEDLNGVRDSSQVSMSLEKTPPEYFGNSGIRKGVLLSRYADLLKNWMIDERDFLQSDEYWKPRVRCDTGIVIPIENASPWEQRSLPLTVSVPYRLLFSDFYDYFKSEMEAIGDYSLYQELEILRTLTW